MIERPVVAEFDRKAVGTEVDSPEVELGDNSAPGPASDAEPVGLIECIAADSTGTAADS